jgi:Leucine-rich repeat (LRR) protein
MFMVIGRLKNLQKLYLGFLELEQFPRELSELANLQELYLDFNNLQSLPPEIGKLKNLRHLNLESNRLKTLPVEIGQLKQLNWLHIGNDLAAEGNAQNQFSEAARQKIRALLPNVKIEFPEK